MDPNTVLAQMRELFKRYEDRTITPEQYREMCELFGALDGWFSRGGFLPSVWFAARQAGL